MKAKFSLSPQNPVLNRYNLILIAALFLFIVFVLPFFTWFEKLAQPFSLAIVIEYFKYNLHHFPISEKQSESLEFTLIYIGMFSLIDLITSLFKIVVTPEKIYHSIFNIPFGIMIERKNIDYCQFGVLKLPQNKATSFLQRPLFNRKMAEPEEKLYFFPLKTLQLDLDISSLQEDKKVSLFSY